MKQIIKAIWKSNEVPTQTNVLWIKREDGHFIMYVYGQEGWEPLYSKNGGGEVTKLDYPIYYGGQSTELAITSSTEETVNHWNTTDKSTTSGINCNEIWYYLSIYTKYSIVSIITENTEPITSLFILKGQYLQNGNTYNLYEFHLSSDMPLDAKFTLKVQ